MPENSFKDGLFIYGASGHAKVIIDAVIKEGKYRIAGIIDDDPKLWKGEFCGYPVIGGENVLKDKAYSDSRPILAIGDNAARQKLWQMINVLGYELACAVHPSAQIGRNVFIGVGTVIMANTAINSGTKIGENVIITPGQLSIMTVCLRIMYILLLVFTWRVMFTLASLLTSGSERILFRGLKSVGMSSSEPEPPSSTISPITSPPLEFRRKYSSNTAI